MTMTYRGIKHNAISSSKQTTSGSVKETYRGIPLLNRVIVR